MRIQAPGINTVMTIESIETKKGQIVMNGQVGAWDSTASMTPEEALRLARGFLRPSVLKLCTAALFRRRSSSS